MVGEPLVLNYQCLLSIVNHVYTDHHQHQHIPKMHCQYAVLVYSFDCIC